MAIFKGEREWRQKCREEYEARQKRPAATRVEPAETVAGDDLDLLTKAELQEYGREVGLSRVTGLSKDELVASIRAHLA